MISEDLLVRYVQRAIEQQEAGQAIDLEELCREHPEMHDRVRDAVALRSLLTGPGQSSSFAGEILDGRYRLGELIGVGAMGEVYEATDTTLDRQVAVKLLQRDLLDHEQRRERFHREARHLATMRHPNIVAVHDHVTSPDGRNYIVMDRLFGAPLSRVLEIAESHAADAAEPYPETRSLCAPFGVQEPQAEYLPMIVHWLADLAAAMADAHAAGVFHRDIKPSNIFITEAGKPVLIDFGIAVREGDPARTSGGTVLGTPWYMAPEQATSTGAVTPAIDVYGVCATLYHMVTFRTPYDGDFAEVLLALQTEDPAPPRRVRSTVPLDLAAIIEKGMDRDPRRRYASMAKLESDLRAFLAHMPVQARPLTRLSRAWRRLRRRPATAIWSGVLVAGVAIAVLLTMDSLHEQRQREVRYRDLDASLPAKISLEAYPEKRLFAAVVERDAALLVLDEMLDLRPDDLGTRLVRAALNLDRGDRVAGTADLRHIALLQPSPFVRAVAERYAQADDSRRGAASVNLAELPEPESEFECFVAGFHALRSRQFRAAHELLGRAPGVAMAKDLRLITFLALAGKAAAGSEERRKLYRDAEAEAVRLQGRYGRETARTCHTIGTARLGRRDYEGAVAPLQRALELRPDRYGPLQNLGVAYRRLSRYDDALAVLTRARDLRPWNWRSYHTISQVHCDRGEFAQAIALAESLPADLLVDDAWVQPHLLASIAREQALGLLRAGKDAEAKAHAKAAVRHYDASLRAGADPRRVRRGRALVDALREGDQAVAFFGYANTALRDIANPVHLANLAGLLPDEPTREVWEAIPALLARIAVALAPGNPHTKRALAIDEHTETSPRSDSSNRKTP